MFNSNTQSRLLSTLKEKVLENIVRKGENVGNQHFLLSPQCFLPETNFNDSVAFILASANAFNLDYSKLLSFDKELSLSQTSPGFYISAVHVV